ncbi:MAG TPA: hypothetical protein DEO82_01965 [Eubacterium sp.]|nr:hypothetical protein [Eubacterium sp.]
MRRILKRIVIFVFISVILELTVFNYRFYESRSFKEYIPEADLESDDYIYEDIDIDLKNVYIKMNSDNRIRVTIYVTDEGHSFEYGLHPMSVIAGRETTSYARIHTSGRCHSIRISCEGDSKKYIESVRFNVKTPFLFNPLRVFICFLILSFISLYRNIGRYDRLCMDKTSSIACLIAIIGINAIIFCSACTFNDIFVRNRYSHHDQYGKLAKAITEGHVYLDDEVADFLTEMENPYDPDARNSKAFYSGQNILYDTAYYNGHYYVYFGIVPCLMFYLPFYIIFGKYLPNMLAVMTCVFFMIAGMVLLLYEISKRVYSESQGRIPLVRFVAVCEIAIFGMYITQVVKRPDFYTVPIVTGIAFCLFGQYLYMKGFKEKPNYALIASGSLCHALAVGCRPSFALLAFVSVWHVFSDRKNVLKKIIYTIFPFIVVAIPIMWYNIIRFGNFMDFGVNYNFTVADMIHRSHDLDRLWFGIYGYVFAPFEIGTEFPFINLPEYVMNYYGCDYYEKPYAGILWQFPQIAIAFYFLFKRGTVKNKFLKLYAVILFVMAGIMIVLDIEAGGLLRRYMLDFSFILSIASATVLLCMCERYNKKACTRVMLLCLSYVVVTGFFAFFFDGSDSMMEGCRSFANMAADALELYR